MLLMISKKDSIQKVLRAVLLLSSVMVLGTACSEDEAEKMTNEFDLPQTISELYPDGSTVGTLKGTVTYDGTKIVEIFYNASQKKVFTYTGDYITKIEHYQAGEIRFEHTYTYADGKLTSYQLEDLLIGNNTGVTYTHQEDGTVLYEEIFSMGGVPQSLKEGVLSFENQNLVADEAEFRFYNVSDEYTELINVLEYDDKPNPYKNIAGYSLLLNFKGSMGNQNIISDYTYSATYKNDVKYAESITGKEYEFAYDKEGRTIQIDRYSNEEIGGDLLYLDRIFKFTY